MMPDELYPDPCHYRKKSHEELVRLLYIREQDISAWRALWKSEHYRRRKLEGQNVEIIP